MQLVLPKVIVEQVTCTSNELLHLPSGLNGPLCLHCTGILPLGMMDRLSAVHTSVSKPLKASVLQLVRNTLEPSQVSLQWNV